jgi:uncharacterized membrane protein YkoI
MKYLIIIFSVAISLAGCSQAQSASAPPSAEPETVNSAAVYTVNINPADFVSVIDNPYFPHLPGTKYVYEGQTEDGLERIEIEVLAETKQVMGIEATVTRDAVYLDGELIEDTFDWFAQDKAGNVWYLGEDAKNYEDGKLVDTDGSWEAGVDGALPGIVMFGDPAAHIGETYRQEYYAGEAEDMADLLSVSESVTIPFGSFENVVQTKDYTPLEPGVFEHKFYAKGIGVIKEANLQTGEEIVLVEFVSTQQPDSANVTLPAQQDATCADDDDAEHEANEEAGDGNDCEDADTHEAGEVEEAASPDQASITAEEAKAAAEAAYPGAKALEVELEKENGSVIYEVELDNGMEVIVDTANGKVLGAEQE